MDRTIITVATICKGVELLGKFITSAIIICVLVF